MKYNPEDMLTSRDDQKYIKRSNERHYITLFPGCEVCIHDKDLLLGDEELFIEENLAILKEQIIDGLDGDFLQTIEKMPEQELRKLLERVYLELDQRLVFDSIFWIAPIYNANPDETKEILADLTRQRQAIREARYWERGF